MNAISWELSSNGFAVSSNSYRTPHPQRTSPWGLHKLLCDANLPELDLFQCRAKRFGCGAPHVSISARFNPRKGGYANTKLCDSDWLRHHLSKYRVFARASGNVGTANGLHARCLAAVWRASPRCGQDRGLLTAKY